MTAPRHLLRWKGRQSGPFAPDEIHTKLKSSEIGLMHEVEVDGQWMTVEKFLVQTAPRPPAPAAPKQEKKASALPVEVGRPKLPAAPFLVPPPPPPSAPLVPPPVPQMPAEHSPPLTRPAHYEPAGGGGPSGETLAYGGFWLRYVAASIDGVIVSAISWAFAAMAIMVSGGTRAPLPPGLVLFILTLYVAGSWLYFALMESSEIQATLGKLAVGLIVTDLTGERITFTHATGRYFGKIISALTLGVGYFMAAFTDHKQTLHDLMAGCHVLLRLPPSRMFQP